MRNAQSVFPNSFNKRQVPVNPWIWTLSELSNVFKYKTIVLISIGQQKRRKELLRIVKQSDEVHRFYYTGVLDIYCCKQFGKLAYKWKFSDDSFHFFFRWQKLHTFTSFLKSVSQTRFVALQMASHSVNTDVTEEHTTSCQIRETSVSLWKLAHFSLHSFHSKTSPKKVENTMWEANSKLKFGSAPCRREE